jgi:hypothetical protein
VYDFLLFRLLLYFFFLSRTHVCHTAPAASIASPVGDIVSQAGVTDLGNFRRMSLSCAELV